MERRTGWCGYGRNWMLTTAGSEVKSIEAIARHYLSDGDEVYRRVISD